MGDGRWEIRWWEIKGTCAGRYDPWEGGSNGRVHLVVQEQNLNLWRDPQTLKVKKEFACLAWNLQGLFVAWGRNALGKQCSKLFSYLQSAGTLDQSRPFHLQQRIISCSQRSRKILITS
jgi:hypothetical protein